MEVSKRQLVFSDEEGCVKSLAVDLTWGVMMVYNLWTAKAVKLSGTGIYCMKGVHQTMAEVNFTREIRTM